MQFQADMIINGYTQESFKIDDMKNEIFGDIKVFRY